MTVCQVARLPKTKSMGTEIVDKVVVIRKGSESLIREEAQVVHSLNVWAVTGKLKRHPWNCIQLINILPDQAIKLFDICESSIWEILVMISSWSSCEFMITKGQRLCQRSATNITGIYILEKLSIHWEMVPSWGWSFTIFSSSMISEWSAACWNTGNDNHLFPISFNLNTCGSKWEDTFFLLVHNFKINNDKSLESVVWAVPSRGCWMNP